MYELNRFYFIFKTNNVYFIRYHEMVVIADSCRSASMYEWINSPNVLSTSSSLTHQESYSHEVDYDIGVYVIDR